MNRGFTPDHENWPINGPPEESIGCGYFQERLRFHQHYAKEPKRRYNFTGPDSRMMMGRSQRHLMYAHNAQAAVDGHAQVIVAAALTQDETDYRMLPMVAAVEEAMGGKPAAITADAGYWDTENVNSETLKGMLALVNPDGRKKKDADEESARRVHESGDGAHAGDARDRRSEGTLPAAQDDRGTGVWADQTRAGHPGTPAARRRENEGGVATDPPDAQPAEALSPSVAARAGQ